MLAEFRRVLAADGALVISSPNKPVYSGETGVTPTQFHVRELTRQELASALDAHFPQQRWYGQRVLAQSVLWSEQPVASSSAQIIELSNDSVHLRPKSRRQQCISS